MFSAGTGGTFSPWLGGIGGIRQIVIEQPHDFNWEQVAGEPLRDAIVLI